MAVGMRVPMVLGMRMFVGSVGRRWNHEILLYYNIT
jgi:hypothetical protein